MCMYAEKKKKIIWRSDYQVHSDRTSEGKWGHLWWKWKDKKDDGRLMVKKCGGKKKKETLPSITVIVIHLYLHPSLLLTQQPTAHPYCYSYLYPLLLPVPLPYLLPFPISHQYHQSFLYECYYIRLIVAYHTGIRFKLHVCIYDERNVFARFIDVWGRMLTWQSPKLSVPSKLSHYRSTYSTCGFGLLPWMWVWVWVIKH